MAFMEGSSSNKHPLTPPHMSSTSSATTTMAPTWQVEDPLPMSALEDRGPPQYDDDVGSSIAPDNTMGSLQDEDRCQDGGRQGPMYDDALYPLLQDGDLLCPICNRQGHLLWDCQGGDQDGASSEEAEQGIFPSAMEASDDAYLRAHTFGGDMVDKVEHGNFPSTKDAHGVEDIEPIPMCLSDELVPIPCEYESHLTHMSESVCEMSDSTICEIECFHFEGMSDTPHELREVVDRSCEAILNSNNLTSTSSVFSHDVLGSMDDETPLLKMTVPQ